MTESAELALRRFANQQLINSGKFANCRLLDVCELTPQASGRKFYRLRLEDGTQASVVMLLHSGSLVPALSGSARKTQEEAFFELAQFLPEHGISVPEIFYYDPVEHLFLLEDVGDLGLWRFAKQERSKELEAPLESLGADPVYTLFCRAIDLIQRYQNIPADPKCIAFQRFLSFENYRREIEEFVEYYAAERSLRAAARSALHESFDAICETICSFPRCLSHFDFNAWNLFVDQRGELRVLDFQDACLVSPARDLLSLINDRCMDETLGRSLHTRLIEYYLKRLAPPAEFAFQYDVTLLHWDLRVSGRFVKLCRKYQTDLYQQWLPGTLRRLGRTLARSYKNLAGLENVFEICCELSPEVQEGSSDPWDFPSGAA